MKRTAYGINKRTMAAFAVAGSILACGGVLMPVSAYADVRQDDVIVGQTVEERQLDQKQAPDISAPIALLVDEDGRTYFSRGADQPVKIASTTKIMTAILTLEHMSLDDSVMVMDEDLKDLPSDGSSAGLKVGDKLTVGDALLGLMIPSGNDAAMVLARACGQAMIDDGTYDGSQSAYDTFVTAMNDKAKDIGCEDTVFTNPSGLDVDKFAGDLHSTASDLAKMAQYAMRNEDFRRIVSTGDTTIPVENSDRKDDEKQLELKSTDLLLDTFDGMLGIKTGSTVEAGNCFVGACERNGKEYYTVVLDAEDRTAVFADTRELFDWITVHNRVYDLKTDGAAEESTGDDVDAESTDNENVEGENVEGGEDGAADNENGGDGEVTEEDIIGYVPHTDWIDKSIPVTYEDPSARVYIFDLDGDFTQTINFNTMSGDVHKGDKCGEIVFEQNGKTVESIDIVAAEDVAAPTPFRAFFISIDRFFRTLLGKDTVAQTELVDHDAESAKDVTQNVDDDGGDASNDADNVDDGGNDNADDASNDATGDDANENDNENTNGEDA